MGGSIARHGCDTLILAGIFLLGSMLTGTALADVEIVAETGVQAPGEAVGVVFTVLNRAPVIGGRGHVAFSGRLSGPGSRIPRSAG